MPKVKPEILSWARETAGLTLEEAVGKLKIHDAHGVAAEERLTALESGETEPTRQMLVKMAKQYRRPLVTFYLSTPPAKGDRGADFRTLPSQNHYSTAEAVPLEAYEEVVAGKEDSLTIWLKDNKINLMLDEQVDVEIVRRIVEEGYAADLTDDEIDKLGNDPFLAAYGLVDGGHRVVVTTEVSKPSRTRANRHLPDVCRYFEIPCVNTFQMVRVLDFRTHWNAE